MERSFNAYKILGVDPMASRSEISQRYKKLALVHHPDKGGDQKEFAQISDAFAILSNDDKRREHDEYLNPPPPPPPSFDLQRSGIFSGIFPQAFYMDSSSSPLQSLLGTFGVRLQEHHSPKPGMNNNNNNNNKGQALVTIEASLEDLFKRNSKSVDFAMTFPCSCQKLRDKNSFEACGHCQGSGMVTTNVSHFGLNGTIIQKSHCRQCQGSGSILVPKAKEGSCSRCDDKGMEILTKNVILPLDPSLRNGEIIPLQETGGFALLKISSHPLFTCDREGNLLCKLKVSLRDSLLGCVKRIPHPNGTQVEVVLPELAGSRPPPAIASGCGMWKDRDEYGNKGDLLVEFEVEYPKHLTEEQRNACILFE